GAARGWAIGLAGRAIGGNEGCARGRYDVGENNDGGQVTVIGDGVCEGDVVAYAHGIGGNGLGEGQVKKRTQLAYEGVAGAFERALKWAGNGKVGRSRLPGGIAVAL